MCTLDEQLAKQKPKVLFVVNNCLGRGTIVDLEAITVEFLPVDMTSVLQPMGQVIMMAKKIYRKNLLRQILSSYENGKGYDINLLYAIHFINDA